MSRRALLSLLNIGVAVGTLAVWFLWPRYAIYALYVFLGWFLIGLSTIWITMRAPRGAPTAPAAGGAAPAAGRGGSAAPLPSSTAAPAPEIGFCIYCAADLPPGAPQCPACGHAVARLG